jgi:FixJ family two-component response regulator
MSDVERRTSLANELRVSGLEVEEYQTAREFQIDKPRRTGGIVFADVRLMSGSTALLEDLKADKAFPLLLMTGAADVPRAIKTGVDFLLTPVSVSDLITAISQCNESVPYDESKLRWGFERLTAREREVIERLAQGLSSREISEEFGTSLKTVEAHRARINDKIRARNIAEAIRMWRAWQAMQ